MKLIFLLLLLLTVWISWRAWHTGTMPAIDEDAPDFRLPDQDGRPHALSDFAGRWLVLYFYPKDDTPGCTREACAFRDGLAKLEAAGAMVAGVSVDTPDSHHRFTEKYRLPFTLLADTDGAVARRYGVLMDWKIFHLARRVTFLINPDGRIKRVYPHVDPDRHVVEILTDLAKGA